MKFQKIVLSVCLLGGLLGLSGYALDNPKALQPRGGSKSGPKVAPKQVTPKASVTLPAASVEEAQSPKVAADLTQEQRGRMNLALTHPDLQTDVNSGRLSFSGALEIAQIPGLAEAVGRDELSPSLAVGYAKGLLSQDQINSVYQNPALASVKKEISVPLAIALVNGQISPENTIRFITQSPELAQAVSRNEISLPLGLALSWGYVTPAQAHFINQNPVLAAEVAKGTISIPLAVGIVRGDVTLDGARFIIRNPALASAVARGDLSVQAALSIAYNTAQDPTLPWNRLNDPISQ